MGIKEPTLRKLRNRGLTPIRYHDGEQNRHGWIIQEGQRGTMTVRLIGNDRNTRLSRNETRYVQVMA